jgi:hypothetical protein
MIRAASWARPSLRLASPLTICCALDVFLELFARRMLHGGTPVAV